MPKVKTESISYRGAPNSEHDYGRKYFQKDVWLDNKTGQFSCKLPEAIAEYLQIKEVRGMTLAEVETEFANMIEAYEEAEVTEKKIIMYQFAYRRAPDTGGYGFYQGIVLSVSASVFTEKEIRAHSGLVVYKYEFVPSSLNEFYRYHGESYGPDTKRKENQVPWTVEREAFFLYVQTNMERLIDMLKDLQSPERLLVFMSAGKILPIGVERAGQRKSREQ